jgi:hypothetical protein
MMMRLFFNSAAQASLLFAFANGSVSLNSKQLPLPGSLVTEISPPISRVIDREMLKPSPVPPYFLVVETSA